MSVKSKATGALVLLFAGGVVVTAVDLSALGDEDRRNPPRCDQNLVVYTATLDADVEASVRYGPAGRRVRTDITGAHWAHEELACVGDFVELTVTPKTASDMLACWVTFRGGETLSHDDPRYPWSQENADNPHSCHITAQVTPANANWGG